MKSKLVLKKRSISNLNIFRLVGGTGDGNSLDDETNVPEPTEFCNNPPTQNQQTCAYTDCHDNCSVNPTQCMVDPMTNP